jgi:hypothetical protein
LSYTPIPEAVTSGEKQKTSRLRLPCETQPLGTASEKIAMRCARLLEKKTGEERNAEDWMGEGSQCELMVEFVLWNATTRPCLGETRAD